MKNFNLKIFALSTITIGVLMVVGFFALFAINEGNAVVAFWKVVGKLFYILSFPTLLLIDKIGYGAEPLILAAGLIINSALYGILIERIFSLRKKKPKFPPGPRGI